MSNNMRSPATLGIHHVTAIAGHPQRNLDFYAGLLGLRLVKLTVNFDDPGSYHFYFGDEIGTPGSILTFFPWPGARSGRPGPGQTGAVAFAVPSTALPFWRERLAAQGVRAEGSEPRFGGEVISFADPDALTLELVTDPGADARGAWGGGPIPLEHAIRGLHSVTLWETQPAPTERLLVDRLGFRSLATEGPRRRLSTGDEGPGTLVDILHVPGAPNGSGGAGTVHHVAWRVKDGGTQTEIRQSLLDHGTGATGIIDRQYFQSVYFREPGGILFELATDGPGFTLDEPAEHLGERLMLPAQYQPEREAIEAILPPVRLPGRSQKVSP